VPAMAASALAGEYGAEYLSIRLLSTPLVYVFCTTRETSYGLGDSRSPMVASLAANVINIALDYVFILVLETGPAGAAWATLIATFWEMTIVIWLCKTPGFRSLARARKWLRAIFAVGFATGLQFAVEVGAFTVLTVLIAAMSEVQMAAHQVALCVVHFAFLPMVAIAEAASVMAGQAVGADRDELVSKVAGHAMLLTGAYSLLCTLVLVLGATDIPRLFGDDGAVRETVTTLLYVAAAFQIGDAINIIARGILRGTGDVRFAALIGVSVSWLALPPLTWLLGHHMQMGAMGGWLAITAEIMVSGGVLWWRMWRGGWRASAARSRTLLLAEA
jgi:multidrug resistance protein, MATE family